MDDSFLCAQVLAGNREAYRLLVLRHQKALFRFLRGFGLPTETVEDLAQEAFIRAHQNLKSFDPEKGQFLAWLVTVARNLALDEFRRLKRSPATGLEAEASRFHGDDAMDLNRAFTQLPEAFKSAFLLSQVRGLSIEEVALIENTSAGTIKSRVFRAKRILQSLLLGEGEVSIT